MQSAGFLGVIDNIVYGNTGVRSSFSQFLNFMQVPVSVLLFFIGYKRSKRISLGSVLLLAIVTFLFLSVLWSTDPQT